MNKNNNNNDRNVELVSQKRVKELECLYNISFELESAGELNKAFENSILHLKRGFQFPEVASVKLEIDTAVYGDIVCTGKRSKNILKEDIIIDGQRRGQIQVCYNENVDFLKEEEKLLREVSWMISKSVERQNFKIKSEKYVKEIEDLLKEKTYEIEKADKRNIDLIEISEELARSRKKLQTLFDSITDTIIVIDSDLNITMSNKKHIGNSGKCYKKLFKSEDICQGCTALRSFKRGNPVSMVKNIDNQYYRLQASPIISDNGSIYNVLERCSNITQEKQMEIKICESYKLASLGKLVAGIAHEINNPNTFILGNIKIIQEAIQDIIPILDGHYRENSNLKIARLPYDIFKENISILMEDMLNGASRIKIIVDGLRKFARKDEGMLIDDVDINSVIESCLRLVGNQIRRNAAININLDKNVPLLKGNTQKLEQVIVNMLMNAHEAITGDNGKICLKTKYDKKNNEIVIKIKDSGHGIERENIKNIFDPFFTTKRDKGGTGLGLSITYGIIKEHNGRIEVDTELNSGTTFTIHIPFTQKEVQQIEE